MIKFDISDVRLFSARVYARILRERQLVGATRESWSSGEGNVRGYLGELTFLDRYHDATWNTTTLDYDVLHKGLRIEVKTNGLSFGEPLAHHEHCIDVKEYKSVDVFVFNTILKDYSCGWFVGWIARGEFFDKCLHIYKGDNRRNSPGKYMADGLCIENNQLNDMAKWDTARNKN